jgi:hypothetical protein
MLRHAKSSIEGHFRVSNGFPGNAVVIYGDTGARVC